MYTFNNSGEWIDVVIVFSAVTRSQGPLIIQFPGIIHFRGNKLASLFIWLVSPATTTERVTASAAVGIQISVSYSLPTLWRNYNK